MSIYINDKYKKDILEFYNIFRKKSKIDYEDLYIDTTFGKTHILTSGIEKRESVIIFQGGNMISTSTLCLFDKLAEKYRIIAPDYLGHPGLSEEKVLNLNNDDYANWIAEIMGKLNIEKVNIVGPSFGGGVALNFAKYYPNKIDKLALIVPSSISYGSYFKMAKELIFPMFKYKLRPSDKNLYNSVYPIYLHEIEKESLDVISLVYRGVKKQGMPKIISGKDLSDFTSPVLLMSCDKDIFFPAAKVIPKAKEIIKNLKVVKEIKGDGHYMSKENFDLCIDEIIDFFKK